MVSLPCPNSSFHERSLSYKEENQRNLEDRKEKDRSPFYNLSQAWLIIKLFRKAPAEQVRG